MYLHIGADASVAVADIIAILDARRAGRAPATREFLGMAESERRVYRPGGGKHKSLVITTAGIYLSPISSGTLKRRAQRPYDTDAE